MPVLHSCSGQALTTGLCHDRRSRDQQRCKLWRRLASQRPMVVKCLRNMVFPFLRKWLCNPILRKMQAHVTFFLPAGALTWTNDCGASDYASAAQKQVVDQQKRDLLIYPSRSPIQGATRFAIATRSTRHVFYLSRFLYLHVTSFHILSRLTQLNI